MFSSSASCASWCRIADIARTGMLSVSVCKGSEELAADAGVALAASSYSAIVGNKLRMGAITKSGSAAQVFSKELSIVRCSSGGYLLVGGV